MVDDDLEVAAEGLPVSGLLEISQPGIRSFWVALDGVPYRLDDASITFCLTAATYEYENLLDRRAANELVQDLTAWISCHLCEKD